MLRCTANSQHWSKQYVWLIFHSSKFVWILTPTELLSHMVKRLPVILTSKTNHSPGCCWIPKNWSLYHFHQTKKKGGKPKIIEFYSQTKTCVVDASDQQIRHYTTYWKTNCWTLAVFTNILDIATYLSILLFKLRSQTTNFNFKPRACY